MDPSQPAPQLCDLDDHLLLQCFAHLTPLPDLFNVAAACRVSAAGSCTGAAVHLGGRAAHAAGCGVAVKEWRTHLLNCNPPFPPHSVLPSSQRFRDLALDRRTWLYVTHSAPPAAAGGLVSLPQRRTPRQERPHQPPPARAPSSASLGGLARSTSAVAVDDSPHWYRQQVCAEGFGGRAVEFGGQWSFAGGSAPVAHGSTAVLGGCGFPRRRLSAHLRPAACPPQFRTLAEAVAASRPGDTILLEAGPGAHLMHRAAAAAEDACCRPLHRVRPASSSCRR